MASKSTEKVTKEIGQNVKTTVEGTKLTIEVDLSKTFGLSATEKTIIVASSKGNQDIGVGDIKLGLNCYKPNPKK